MKKFMKSFIKTLSLIFVVAFASLPFIGCSNKSANKNTNSPALENIADTGNEEESSENVSTEEETPVATEIKELNGIYKMARTIGYKDTWFEKQEDAIKFFNTKDINGVYNALRVLDFSKYYNSYVIKIDEKDYEVMYRFNGPEFTRTYNEVGTSVYKEKDESMLKTADNFLKFEESATEAGVVYAYSQYSYIDANTQKEVKTPVYIKIPLTKVSGSENVLTGSKFTYKANTASVILTNESTYSAEKAINEIATAFAIKEDVADKNAAIVDVLETWNFVIANDASKITIVLPDGSYKYTNNSANTFTVDGVTFTLSTRVSTLEPPVNEIMFSISLDAYTTFVFTFTA